MDNKFPYMRTPLTEEQASDLRYCWDAWLRIRAENGHDQPPTSSDIFKGALLGRMTMDGKPPLSGPPPTHYSRPWWEVVENNGADLLGHQWGEVEGPYDNPLGLDGRYVSIRQNLWKIEEDTPNGYLLTHDRLDGVWTLRHRTTEDPQVRAGTHMGPNGAEALYMGTADWILIGPVESAEITSKDIQ